VTRTNAHVAPTRQPAPRDVTTRGRPSALSAWTVRHPLSAFLAIVFWLPQVDQREVDHEQAYRSGSVGDASVSPGFHGGAVAIRSDG
jgi:hypothetical protein